MTNTIPAKTDSSYGVIPYRRSATGIEFFVIHQNSHWRGDRYWVFPKGHPEGNESPLETAVRELNEETGLRVRALHEDRPIVVAYSFKHEGMRVDKTVTYFLGEVTDEIATLDNHEVTDGQWLGADEARQQLTHANTKQALNQALGLLRQGIH